MRNESIHLSGNVTNESQEGQAYIPGVGTNHMRDTLTYSIYLGRSGNQSQEREVSEYIPGVGTNHMREGVSTWSRNQSHKG